MMAETTLYAPPTTLATAFEGLRPARKFASARTLLSNPVALTALTVLTLVALAALFAPFLTSHDPTFLDPGVRLLSPSSDNWFGTDAGGRDVLTRVIYGGRTSLLIGTTVTLAAALAGALLGLLSGFYPRLDTPIARTLDGMMAFPSILLAIAIMAARGPSTFNVFIALTVVYTPSIARLVRSTTLVTKQQPYVESARSIGMSDAAILAKYVFPNGISPLIVQCTFVVAYAIISEASLSFLGAGVNPETPTWGNMLKEGQQHLQRAWWLAVFPGAALVITVLSLNLFGDGLRDALDPRARKR
jgi:peptide/nickel transport system permease protein